MIQLVLFLLLEGAFAGTETAYPLVGELTLERGGVHRIDLGPEWLARCPDPSSYLITDGSGAEVPFAVRTSDQHPPGLEALTWEPVQVSRAHWSYRVHPPASGAPVRALRVRSLSKGTVLRVEIRSPGSDRRVTGWIWNLPDTGAGVGDQIALPRSMGSGPWHVDADVVTCLHRHARVEFEGVTETSGQVAEVVFEVPVDPPMPVSNTESELPISLPREGLPVRSIELSPEDGVFSRPIVLRGEGTTVLGRGILERHRIGEVWVEQTRIPVRFTAGRQVTMQIDDGRSPVLSVDSVTVGIRGAVLIVPDAEPGTYGLFGCGPTGRRYDLDRMGQTLATGRAVWVAPSTPSVSPVWVNGMIAEGMAAPVPGSAPASFGGALDVQSEGGLTRVSIPLRVISQTRDGLPDLRFKTSEGHVIPHVLARSAESRLDGVRWSQEQLGEVTRLRVVAPEDSLPVERMVLQAERTHFDREFRVLVEGRAVMRGRWLGAGEETSRQVVELHQRMPRAFVVEIDNGDNLPLPLLAPTLTYVGSEARFVHPSNEVVTLWFGSPSVRRGVFDLERVGAQLLDSPAQEGVMVERHLPGIPPLEASLHRPTHAGARRPWMIVVVAVMAVALGMLALRLATEADDQDEPCR